MHVIHLEVENRRPIACEATKPSGKIRTVALAFCRTQKIIRCDHLLQLRTSSIFAVSRDNAHRHSKSNPTLLQYRKGNCR